VSILHKLSDVPSSSLQSSKDACPTTTHQYDVVPVRYPGENGLESRDNLTTCDINVNLNFTGLAINEFPSVVGTAAKMTKIAKVCRYKMVFGAKVNGNASCLTFQLCYRSSIQLVSRQDESKVHSTTQLIPNRSRTNSN
jgi:hypothetical protein